MTAFSSITLRYTNEQFDLNNEYDLTAFVPNRRGVYSIEASALFSPANANQTSNITISIMVNDILVASSNEIIPPGGANSIKVSTISELQAGDRVTITFVSNQSGTIFQSSPFASMGTAFEAARFPSPSI